MAKITGEVNATLPGLSIAPAGPPHTFLGVAEALLPGVKFLADATPPPAVALSLLAAHTVECLLKAFISRAGCDSELEKELKYVLGHNLRALWERAASEGLQVSLEVPGWVDRLSQVHDYPYYLRYSEGVHGIGTPLVSSLAELSETVRRSL